MKYYIELNARDVINIEDIDEFIRDVCFSDESQYPEEIELWCKKQLRYYIKEKLDSVTKVKKYKETDPDWLKKGVKNGTVLKVNLTNDFYKRCVDILTYFKSLPNNELKKIYKLDFDVAEKKTKDWFEDLNKKSIVKEDPNGIKTVRKYKDNYSWVEVFSKQSLKREGKLMHNCVGDGEYYEEIKNNKLNLYSLRDSKNLPHCTISVAKHEVSQIFGFANGPVKTKYFDHVRNFIEKPFNRIPYKEVKGLMGAGILVQNDIWYPTHELPDNFTVDDDLDFTKLAFEEELENDDRNFKKIDFLPKNLTVKGTVWFHNCEITLPESININKLRIVKSKLNNFPPSSTIKYINMTNSTLNTVFPENMTFESINMGNVKNVILPKKMYVLKGLKITNSELNELPNIEVNGDITLDKSTISKLSDNFTCNGILSLKNCIYLNKLPENLTSVYLNLYGTRITTLPKTLKVSEILDCSHSKIKKLPDDFKLEGALDLSYNFDIQKLPENLEIFDELYIHNTYIKEIPDSASIHGNILHSNENLKYKPYSNSGIERKVYFYGGDK